MKLFTVEKREAVKSRVLEMAESLEAVSGVILVGSGAEGFTDELSDLDFCLVLRDESGVPETVKKLEDIIRRELEVTQLISLPNRGLSIFLLSDFLEIDIGFVLYSNLYAARGRWLVLLDRVGGLDERMKQIWEKTKDSKHGKSHEVDVASRVATGDAWHYLFHAAEAIARGKPWRAVGEMDFVRNMAVEFLGYRYSLDSGRYRDVDDFPEEILKRLKRTYPLTHKAVKLKKALLALSSLLYDLLTYYQIEFKIEIPVKREQVLFYIEEVCRRKEDETVSS